MCTTKIVFYISKIMKKNRNNNKSDGNIHTKTYILLYIFTKTCNYIETRRNMKKKKKQ